MLSRLFFFVWLGRTRSKPLKQFRWQGSHQGQFRVRGRLEIILASDGYRRSTAHSTTGLKYLLPAGRGDRRDAQAGSSAQQRLDSCSPGNRSGLTLVRLLKGQASSTGRAGALFRVESCRLRLLAGGRDNRAQAKSRPWSGR